MIRHTGANMETVRKRNRAAILKFINDHGPASRKDLADALGLTPAAVPIFLQKEFLWRPESM